jgi:hypothetical protein
MGAMVVMVEMDKQEEMAVTGAGVAMESRLMEFYLALEEMEVGEEMEEMEAKGETGETVEPQGKTEKKEICLHGKNSFSF